MIRFENVVKRYPDGTTAVDGLDLDIPGGSITTMVGPSGSGKTTALRMINRMIEPTEGRILLDGEDVRDQDPRTLRRGIGYVIQHAGLFPHRTVVDNVATTVRLAGGSRAEARERALGMLERVGLGADLAARYPAELSGGQQQRVGVARALAADPPVLLMDEPFSAVDPVVRVDLQRQLLDLQSSIAKTIVLVTHDIDEAITLGDQVVVLRPGGHLAQVATPTDLLVSPADDFVAEFVGVDRGVRLLSFFPSTDLALSTEPVVRGADARGVHDRGWILVTDDDGRPVGWWDSDLAPVPEPDTASFESVGHTYTAGSDSLRAALDSAVLSPSGHAVGVDGDGRVVGVISDVDLGAAIRRRHAARDVTAPTA